MDELSRKFRSFDWKGLQKSARRMQASTASALKDLVMTDLENKVRAATSDTTWGASGSDLMQIAQGTFNREDYALIMSIVWQRLGSSRWRCVYKALEVLRYLIMHGAARCTEEARAASHHIQTLQHFRYVDPKTHHDHGEGVRMRAKLVCDMLADESVLEEEREKSKDLRAKLQGGMGIGPRGRLGGLSSDDYAYGYGTSQGSGSSHMGVTTASTGGVGNFKGYGDDDDNGRVGGYDDAPAGMFAKRAAGQAGKNAKSSADVPDLLGDTVEGENGADDEVEDDDDFDPRAGGAPQLKPTAVDDDDLFGTLGLGGSAVKTNAPAHLAITEKPEGRNVKELPRSLLIQNLAHQQQQQLNPYLSSGPYQAPGSAQEGKIKEQTQEGFGNANNWSTGAGGGATSLGFNMSGGGVGDSMTMNQTAGGSTAGVKPTASTLGSSGDVKPKASTTGNNGGVKPLITSKADKDPFADLLDSAKKTGVL